MTTHSVVLPLFSPLANKPEKRYRTLVADPPWRYDAPAYGYGADANYPTMSVDDLLNLPVGLWAEPDKAHLYLWTTNSFLVEAHRIAKAWGFEPKTVLTWIKRRPKDDEWIGMGRYFRGVTEHVVFAVRGNLDTRRNDQPNFIETVADESVGLAFYAARGRHSQKPAAFYDMVERMSYGPFLDIFARVNRFNWDTFGNESFDFREHALWHKDGEA